MSAIVGGGFRPEIQGLRAVAVLAVLVFHVWPEAMSGGYVGVDVFFVISGYLITGILLREAETSGKISVLGFYARRIRRLLPAATVVLIAVGVCISVLPVARWEGTAYEIAASALYIENWWLASNSIDYLALESAPSPLQHYWSLSIEEQYYIFWPAALALAWLIPGAQSRPRLLFGSLLAGIGVASLLYSIHVTPKSPGFAYFATTTRAWELAVGGGLAVYTGWRRLPQSAQVVAGYLGLAAIAFSSFNFGPETSFPGYHALLPILGAAMVIVSGSARWGPYEILRARMFQYIGDISYSLYLWHWPVVIFYLAVSGKELGLVDGIIVIGISVALAHQSKNLIEDYFRDAGFFTRGVRLPFALAVACVSWTICSALFIGYQSQRHIGTATLDRVTSETHPGAMTLFAGTEFDVSVPFQPQPLQALKDQSLAYRDGCIVSATGVKPRQCRYGDRNAKRHIVLVGDSHAVHWIPALDDIAKRNQWRLTVITKSACPLAKVEADAGLSDQVQSCIDWNQEALKLVLNYKPEIVIFAQARASMASVGGDGSRGVELVAEGIVSVWRDLEHAGISVVAIRDTPRMRGLPAECMAEAGASSKSCARPRAETLSAMDPLLLAAQRHPSALLVDMTDSICGPELCEPVVGNVFVWRDTHHLTATYGSTLAIPLQEQLASVLIDEPSNLSLKKTAR